MIRFAQKVLKYSLNFLKLAIAGIDDLAEKKRNAIERGPVGNLNRSLEINRKILRGEHATDDLIEQAIIDETFKGK